MQMRTRAGGQGEGRARRELAGRGRSYLSPLCSLRRDEMKARRRERDQSEIPPASAFFTYGFRTFEKGARAVNTIGRALGPLSFFFRAAPPLFFPSWGRGVA